MNGWEAALERALRFSSINSCRCRIYGERRPSGWRYYFRSIP